jgi:acyl-CoA synthetase (NDP forming)
VKLYDDYERLKETFSGMMPYFGSAKNPIDLTGEATSSLYRNAFHASLEDPDIHGLVSMYCETAVFDIENLSPIIEENYHKFKDARKPTVFCLVGGQKTENCVEHLRALDVPVFTDPYEAVSCMGAMYTYYHYLKEPPGRIDLVSLDMAQIEQVIKS